MLIVSVNRLYDQTATITSPILQVTLEEPGKGDKPFAHEAFLHDLYAKIIAGEDFTLAPTALDNPCDQVMLAMFQQALTQGTVIPEKTTVDFDSESDWFGSYKLEVVLSLSPQALLVPLPQRGVSVAFALVGLPDKNKL